MHVIAGKAVCLKEAMSDDFKAYQQQIVNNAAALAAELQKQGLRLVSGGTDNHLMLVDLSALDCTGKDLEKRLDAAHITVNKNTIPFETRSPFVTSGVRIGTPAATSRGMKEPEMALIGQWIAKLAKEGDSAVEEVKQGVLKLCERFPLYPEVE